MGRVVNLGSGREISVGDLVRLIAGMMNRNIKLSSERRRLRPGQSEVERLLPDGGLARSLRPLKARPDSNASIVAAASSFTGIFSSGGTGHALSRSREVVS